MGTLEIVLLLIGGIVVILSFALPARQEGSDKDTKAMVQEEVKNVVASEVDGIKSKVEDIVDETVNYAMEKTERALERVSNEKIMAVNEYSDTVLEDINKNHKEVMFLYDMLNDKHDNIKTTVSQVEKTVKEVEQSAKEVKTALSEQPKEMPENEDNEAKEENDFVMLMPQKVSSKKVIRSKQTVKATGGDTPEMDISFMKDNRKNGNNNERILTMHNEGKSNVAIAKELGLGIGEVKLVIDLFEGL